MTDEISRIVQSREQEFREAGRGEGERLEAEKITEKTNEWEWEMKMNFWLWPFCRRAAVSRDVFICSGAVLSITGPFVFELKRQQEAPKSKMF